MYGIIGGSPVDVEVDYTTHRMLGLGGGWPGSDIIGRKVQQSPAGPGPPLAHQPLSTSEQNTKTIASHSTGTVIGPSTPRRFRVHLVTSIKLSIETSNIKFTHEIEIN